MTQRYDPKVAHRRVLSELAAAATDAWLTDKDEDAYSAALLDAGRQARQAADEERARLNRWRALRLEILRDNEWCHYCGEGATQVDHLIPYSRGGADTRDNLVPACASCNMEKLDFTPDEWRDYRLGLGQSWPPEGFNARLRRIVTETVERYA